MQPLTNRHINRLPPLGPGDRIGIAAPASPFDHDRFFAGVALLEGMGFDVVCSDDIFSRDGYLAGGDATRLTMLHDLFADPAIKAIWCARGGYGSMRLLPYLDKKIICENPKPFIGCSDITAILIYLWAECGIPSFHGPMIITLADADEKSVRSISSVLSGNLPIVLQAGDPETIVAGCAEGVVVGGNLSTLSHLAGTPFFPDLSGAIVFLEDVGEKPYRIDRMLTQLLFSGCLEDAAGICLGSFHDCGENDQIQKVLADRLSSLPIPVVAGFPAGHGMPCLTLPIGFAARLDAGAGSLSYADIT